MTSRGQSLYLFSSDQSPLYAQDILNVLGAPKGHRYTFRYDERYLGPALQESWSELQDTRVLVVFALQQRAEYHAPAFIPIRSGYVVTTNREGDSYFVDFQLGEYVSLHAPLAESGREDPGARVHAFTSVLADLTAVPYAASISLGDPLPKDACDEESDQTVQFERIAQYLSLTAAFAAARFVRMLGIKPTGGTEGDRLRTSFADPTFILQAGSTYDLDLYHAQPVAPDAPESFFLDVDGSSIRTIGRAGFSVASRYDRVTLRMAATEAAGLEDRETVVSLTPGQGVQGPALVLNVRVRARRQRAAGIAGLQAMALVAVALASTLSMWPLGARVALAVLGALAAVALGLLGGIALKPPSLPSAPKDSASVPARGGASQVPS